MPPQTDQSQFDGKTPVAGYTLFHGKDGKSYYLKGENLSDDDLAQRVTQLRAGVSSTVAPLPESMRPTQSFGTYGGSREATSKIKSFPDIPANIEQAGQRSDVQKSELQRREQRASQSPTPVSNAVSIFAPVTAARQVLGAKVGAPIGRKVGPYVGLTPEQGEVAGGVTGQIVAGGAPHAIEARAPSLEVPEKINLPFGFKINRNVPPPPEPPEVVEYNRAKTITEAQEAAQAENESRTAKTQRAAKQAAREREAKFNKEGQENAAIQKRYDDAQEARVQAEKEAKNNRLKAEQAHEKNLKDAEMARQKEITAQARVRQIQEQMDAADKAKDAKALDSLKSQMEEAEKNANQAAAQKERLRTMHGDDLMRRGKEQAALDKAAEDAGGEETTAKAELEKTKPSGGSGGAKGRPRPTSSEKYLTGLVKKNILSPDEFRTLRSELGADATPRTGESNAAWRARVLGLIRSSRAAQGMGDISSGPSTANIRGTTPTGAPKISFTTDANGIRWASSPESPNPVSIPKSVPEGEVPQYAAQKLQEQARMARSVKANQGNVAYRARPVGQAGVPSAASPQATMDPEQAQQYAQHLANQTGQPHEVATIDLTKTPHTKVPHPSGATWVQFGEAHPEDVITGKSGPVGPKDTGEFQF